MTLVTLLWLVVTALGVLMYSHDRSQRRDMLTGQLEVFNNVLLHTYHDDTTIADYLNFIENYFKDTPLDDVVVAVFDGYTGDYIDGTGYQIKAPADGDKHGGVLSGDEMELMTIDSIGYSSDDLFFYKTSWSSDSSMMVRTVMPYNVSISRALSADKFLWIVIVLVLGVMTLIAYVTTRHISRNICLLRDFVNRTVNDRDFVVSEKFPDDELGEISRQVVQIYNSRSAAIAAREYEHNSAMRAIEERARIKRRLTSNISHELKTPVGIIKGYIDTVLLDPEMDGAAREHFLVKAQMQVDRLCDLVNDLSTMTRLDESNGSVTLEPVNVAEVATGVVDDVVASGLSGGISIVVDVPDDCVVTANRVLLNVVLLNLVKNAVSYSGGTEIVFRCTDAGAGGVCKFVFYDNGVGVPAESVSHLFERFYRVDTGRSRRNGGTGLGLSIVKGSIVSCGGDISVANRAEGGLQFTFTLNSAQR